jgi:Ni/Fe-hydrogenase subunit HybB-like protein
MLEKALTGSRSYKVWVVCLLIIFGIGFLNYLRQLNYGLGITGMSRDVSWGLYIGQFTFLVGVAASAVMLVLPYYLHNYKVFGKITILGEFLAVASVTMCLSFIVADLGQPARAFNVLLYPTPNSVLFWDMVVLNGYLFLNIVIGWAVLGAERRSAPPPKWVKPLIYLSIPWAISIHTVTAFLYSGLSARPFWMTPVLAPRFLASAFASGPSLLIILALILRKFTKFEAGKEAIQKLATIVTYALLANVFFTLVEVFTAFYSNMPHHLHPFEYLFGLHGHSALAPWMWTCELLTVGCVVLLLLPGVRKHEGLLAPICVAVIAAVWIEKGMGTVVTGFVPSPLGKVTEYLPTAPEVMITLGVYGIGFLLLSVLCKIVVDVRERIQAA